MHHNPFNRPFLSCGIMTKMLNIMNQINKIIHPSLVDNEAFCLWFIIGMIMTTILDFHISRSGQTLTYDSEAPIHMVHILATVI